MKLARVSASDIASEIMETESAWVAAVNACDFTSLDRLAADEFTAVLPDGLVLQRDTALNHLCQPASHGEMHIDMLDVRLHGKVALVIGRANYDKRGFRGPSRTRFVSTLVLRDAVWQRVLEQHTAIA
jgi:ketosteroid isomerase-like protein